MHKSSCLYDGMDLEAAIMNIEREIIKYCKIHDTVPESMAFNVTLKFLKELKELREKVKKQ